MEYLTIGISGKSAAGKTYFLKMLMSMFNNNSYSYIDLDGYHNHGRKDRHRLNEFPEDINANDIERIIKDIKKIKSGRKIEIPTYNHLLGNFSKNIEVYPKPIIFVEGLHATLLNEIAREKIIDFTIHLNPSHDLQKTWKIHRDILERGYDFNTVINELNGRKVFEKKYIQPQVMKSDVVIKINKINLMIKHALLLVQTNNLTISKDIENLFHLKEIKIFKNKYFQLSRNKNYNKLIYKYDKYNLLNFGSSLLLIEPINNSIEDIVLISSGLIILFKKYYNYGQC